MLKINPTFLEPSIEVRKVFYKISWIVYPWWEGPVVYLCLAEGPTILDERDQLFTCILLKAALPLMRGTSCLPVSCWSPVYPWWEGTNCLPLYWWYWWGGPVVYLYINERLPVAEVPPTLDEGDKKFIFILMRGYQLFTCVLLKAALPLMRGD